MYLTPLSLFYHPLPPLNKPDRKSQEPYHFTDPWGIILKRTKGQDKQMKKQTPIDPAADIEKAMASCPICVCGIAGFYAYYCVSVLQRARINTKHLPRKVKLLFVYYSHLKIYSTRCLLYLHLLLLLAYIIIIH